MLKSNIKRFFLIYFHLCFFNAITFYFFFVAVAAHKVTTTPTKIYEMHHNYTDNTLRLLFFYIKKYEFPGIEFFSTKKNFDAILLMIYNEFLKRTSCCFKDS